MAKYLGIDCGSTPPLTANKNYHKMKNAIYNQLFNLFLFLIKFDTFNSNNSQIYDQYGPIDTLGFKSSVGKFTASYSDELISMYFIRIPFYWIRLVNDGEQRIEFCKSIYA